MPKTFRDRCHARLRQASPENPGAGRGRRPAPGAEGERSAERRRGGSGGRDPARGPGRRLLPPPLLLPGSLPAAPCGPPPRTPPLSAPPAPRDPQALTVASHPAPQAPAPQALTAFPQALAPFLPPRPSPPLRPAPPGQGPSAGPSGGVHGAGAPRGGLSSAQCRLRLPGMSGGEVTQRLRSDAELKDLAGKAPPKPGSSRAPAR